MRQLSLEENQSQDLKDSPPSERKPISAILPTCEISPEAKVLDNAVITVCGHTFERDSIVAHREHQQYCPECLQPLAQPLILKPNYQLKTALQNLCAYEDNTLLTEFYSDQWLSKALSCPITQKYFEDPVLLLCGHSVERKAAKENIRNCPCCKVDLKEMKENEFKPNAVLRKLCENLKDYIFPDSMIAWFYSAVKKGDLKSVQDILKVDPLVLKHRNMDQDTPLHYAIRHNQLAITEWLLERKADVTVQNQKKQTPILLAAYLGRWDHVLKFPSRNLVDNNNRGNYGRALLEAAKNNQRLVVFNLLDKGAGWPIYGDRQRLCALHYAIAHNDREQIQALSEIQLEATQFEDNQDEIQPVIYFAMADDRVNIETLQWLLKIKDISVNFLYEGQTALMIGVQKGARDKIQVMLEHPNIRLDLRRHTDSRTALDIAQQKGVPNQKAVVAYLKFALLQKEKPETKEVKKEVAHLPPSIMASKLKNSSHDPVRVACWMEEFLTEINPADWKKHLLTLHKNPHYTSACGLLLPAIAVKALAAKQMDFLKELILQNRSSINQPINSDGDRLLHAAVRQKALDLIVFLLNQKADPRVINQDGFTPFYLAAHLNHWNCLKVFPANDRAETKEQKNQDYQDYGKALFKATQENQTDAALLLIDKKAPLNYTEGDLGLYPIHQAVLHNNIQVIQVLLNARSDINLQRSLRHPTPLILAVREKTVDLKTVQFLIDHKEIEVEWTQYQETALHIAIRNKDWNKARILIRKPHRLNRKDKEGQTLLIKLLNSHDEALILELRWHTLIYDPKNLNQVVDLKAGCSNEERLKLMSSFVVLKSFQAFSPLEWHRRLIQLKKNENYSYLSQFILKNFVYQAFEQNQTAFIQLLLESPLENLEQRFGPNQDTLMHLAIRFSQKEILKQLFQRDFPHLKNSDQLMPMPLAVQLNPEVISLFPECKANDNNDLLGYGAALNAAAEQNDLGLFYAVLEKGASLSIMKAGLSVLHHAVLNNNTSILLNLLQMGADINLQENSQSPTPLILAVSTKKVSLDILALLINYPGININQVSNDETPLMIAIKKRRWAKARLLLQTKGVNLHYKQKTDGKNAYQIARDQKSKIAPVLNSCHQWFEVASTGKIPVQLDLIPRISLLKTYLKNLIEQFPEHTPLALHFLSVYQKCRKNEKIDLKDEGFKSDQLLTTLNRYNNFFKAIYRKPLVSQLPGIEKLREALCLKLTQSLELFPLDQQLSYLLQAQQMAIFKDQLGITLSATQYVKNLRKLYQQKLKQQESEMRKSNVKSQANTSTDVKDSISLPELKRDTNKVLPDPKKSSNPIPIVTSRTSQSFHFTPMSVSNSLPGAISMQPIPKTQSLSLTPTASQPETKANDSSPLSPSSPSSPSDESEVKAESEPNYTVTFFAQNMCHTIKDPVSAWKKLPIGNSDQFAIALVEDKDHQWKAYLKMTVTAGAGATDQLLEVSKQTQVLGWNSFDDAVEVIKDLNSTLNPLPFKTPEDLRRHWVRVLLDHENKENFREMLSPEIRKATLMTGIHLNNQKNDPEMNKQLLEVFDLYDAFKLKRDSKEVKAQNPVSLDLKLAFQYGLPPEMHDEKQRVLVNNYCRATQFVNQFNQKLKRVPSTFEQLQLFFVESANQTKYPEAFQIFQQMDQIYRSKMELSAVHLQQCNTALNRTPFTLTEMARFFETNTAAEYKEMNEQFQHRYPQEQEAFNTFQEFILRPETYRQYLTNYYGKNQPIEYHRCLAKDVKTSVVHLLASVMKKQVVIYPPSRKQKQPICDTLMKPDYQGKIIELRYRESNRVIQLFRIPANIHIVREKIQKNTALGLSLNQGNINLQNPNQLELHGLLRDAALFEELTSKGEKQLYLGEIARRHQKGDFKHLEGMSVQARTEHYLIEEKAIKALQELTNLSKQFDTQSATESKQNAVVLYTEQLNERAHGVKSLTPEHFFKFLLDRVKEEDSEGLEILLGPAVKVKEEEILNDIYIHQMVKSKKQDRVLFIQHMDQLLTTLTGEYKLVREHQTIFKSYDDKELAMNRSTHKDKTEEIAKKRSELLVIQNLLANHEKTHGQRIDLGRLNKEQQQTVPLERQKYVLDIQGLKNEIQKLELHIMQVNLPIKQYEAIKAEFDRLASDLQNRGFSYKDEVKSIEDKLYDFSRSNGEMKKSDWQLTVEERNAFVGRLKEEIKHFGEERLAAFEKSLEGAVARLCSSDLKDSLMPAQVELRYRQNFVDQYPIYLRDLTNEFLQSKAMSSFDQKRKLASLIRDLKLNRVLSGAAEDCQKAVEKESKLQGDLKATPQKVKEAFNEKAKNLFNDSKNKATYRKFFSEYLVSTSNENEYFTKLLSILEKGQTQKCAHLSDGNKNTLMHHAILIYAILLKDSKTNEDNKSKNKKRLKKLGDMIKFLYQQGCHPYQLNEDRQGGLGKTAYEYANATLQEPGKEIEFLVPDWALLQLDVEFMPTYSEVAAQIKDIFKRYIGKSKAQMDNFIRRLFISVAIKEMRRRDMGDFLQTFREGQKELSDQLLVKRIKTCMERAERVQSSTLYLELKRLLDKIEKRELMCLETDPALVQSARDKQVGLARNLALHSALLNSLQKQEKAEQETEKAQKETEKAQKETEKAQKETEKAQKEAKEAKQEVQELKAVQSSHGTLVVQNQLLANELQLSRDIQRELLEALRLSNPAVAASLAMRFRQALDSSNSISTPVLNAQEQVISNAVAVNQQSSQEVQAVSLMVSQPQPSIAQALTSNGIFNSGAQSNSAAQNNPNPSSGSTTPVNGSQQ